MLSLGVLAPGKAQYYLDTVASGVEDYYTGAGEAPGQWVGRAAALLGLEGEVVGDDLHAVLASRHPDTGDRLTRAQGAPKVPGFDATFSAPKSVSLLFAIGSPEVSNEVRNAHDTAVDRALEVLEDETARARRGKGGLTQVGADGFVATAFRHRTSRAGDPQLHTHVLIANVVHCPDDDRWSALDARPLFGWAKTAGYLYEAQLRAELTRRLGVTWDPVSNGISDIIGIDREVVWEFSQRRQQIEDHLDERGLTSARSAQIAAYATREAKDPTVTVDDLLPEWRDRAAAFGIDERTLDNLCGVSRRHDVARPVTGRLFDRLASPSGLTEKRSTFGRRDVIMAICDALPTGGDADEIVRIADAFLVSHDIVPLGTIEGERIRRADGTSAPARVDDTRFTTTEMLATEQRVVEIAESRRDAGAGIAGAGELTAAIDRRPTLSSEQRDMVAGVCSSGAGVDIVEGVAGAGKTFALAAARDAWAASGYEVIGAALAARAAEQLEEGSGIPSSTVDRLLGRLERSEASALTARHIVVVDEAAMVGTRKLLRLLERAEQAEAKVVLVGDPRQLPEIEAGGAFAGLARRLAARELTDNRRQQEPWELDALAELRTGDTDQALDTYRSHGRVHEASTSADAMDCLVDDWLSARAGGEQPLMLAGRRSQVEELNRIARQALQEAGEIGPDQLGHRDLRFAIGDEVLALRNDYRLDVLNGTRGTVTDIDREHHEMVVAISAQRSVRIPFDYIADGHLTHAYAMTIHKAQGATADRVLLLADDTLSREHAYTGLSRGVTRNDLYLVVEDPRAEIRHVAESIQEPDEAVRAAVRRSGAKTMALDEMAVDQRDPVSALETARGKQEPVDAEPGSLRTEWISDLYQVEVANPGIERAGPEVDPGIDLDPW
jgi:conjugative relaxase-like TrwC/TraI family protein